MINQTLNYLSTAIFNYILCVKVCEACFDRKIGDLLHTSTSCHFKICLKSHKVTLYRDNGLTKACCGVFGAFAEDGTRGRSRKKLTDSVASLFQILDQCDLTA